MVEVTIEYFEDKIRSFKVTGHAGYAQEGEDIYCAGISAITQTALLGLLKHLSVKPTYSIEKGFLDCKLSSELNEKDLEKAQIILTTMEAGLLSLQEAYSDYMKVQIRRCL